MILDRRGAPQSPARTGIPVYLPHSQIVVGYVDGRVFRKTISGSKHLLRSPKALAFDVATLEAAERAGAEFVAVTDRETAATYRTSIAYLREHGFPVNRAFGAQIALTLDLYSVNGEPPEAERRAAVTNRERLDLQLSLFGGNP